MLVSIDVIARGGDTTILEIGDRESVAEIVAPPDLYQRTAVANQFTTLDSLALAVLVVLDRVHRHQTIFVLPILVVRSRGSIRIDFVTTLLTDFLALVVAIAIVNKQTIVVSIAVVVVSVAKDLLVAHLHSVAEETTTHTTILAVVPALLAIAHKFVVVIWITSPTSKNVSASHTIVTRQPFRTAFVVFVFLVVVVDLDVGQRDSFLLALRTQFADFLETLHQHFLLVFFVLVLVVFVLVVVVIFVSIVVVVCLLFVFRSQAQSKREKNKNGRQAEKQKGKRRNKKAEPKKAYNVGGLVQNSISCIDQRCFCGLLHGGRIVVVVLVLGESDSLGSHFAFFGFRSNLEGFWFLVGTKRAAKKKMSRLFEVYQRLERSLLVTHRGKYAAVVSNSSSAEDEADDVDTFFFDTLEECVRFAKRYPFAYYTRVGSESWVDLVSDDDEDKEQKEEGKEEEDSEATEVLLDEKENEKEEDSEATEVLIDKKEEEWAIGGVIQKNKNNKRHLEWWGQYAALGGGSDEDDEKERGDIGDNEDDWKKRGGRSEAAERERERERLEKWKDEDEDEDEEIEGDTDDDELSEHERYLRRLQRLEDHEWERKGFSTSYYGGGGDTEERNNEEKEKDQYWQSYTTTDNDDWWKTRGAETGWKEYGAQKINKWRQGFNSWKEDARAKIYGSSHGGSYYSFPQRQTCRKYVWGLFVGCLLVITRSQICGTLVKRRTAATRSRTTL